ncbi:helix-turn-helix domain-containing protein [Psychrobacter pacificensis]|uniref:helix-turn-helix domain-containing protein n=1 Tax=Psychrobacter pacificensis TaxID=112002 RepID=UPI001CC0494C|nr:helix-turn-helix transcriptional regulator [Psychrobacter pacificensis]MBZ1392776.1 helix-turn-helix transcriptional regulator [Psychrobacter pacificensis]
MKQPILIKFGQRIRELRKVRNLSQEQLAELTGFHRNYIGMIERGERNPALINIEIFANAFEISLSELFEI